MKKVFSNSQCAHVWAQQSQHEGRNAKSSIFFEGKTIFSYGYHFWMGHFVTPEIVILNSNSYSVTTSSHQSETSGAVWHLKTFTAPSYDDHEKNKKYFLDNIEFHIARASNARRVSTGWRPSTSLENANQSLTYAQKQQTILNDYCVTFKLINDFVWPTERVAEIRAKKEANDAKWDTPDAEAKREKTKAGREKAERKRKIKKTRKAVKTFLDGGGRDYTWQTYPVLLRLDGETIKTSQGAEMPVKFAKAIWQMVAKCKASGTTFEPNGRKISAGHFEVNKIDSTGNLKAGCHSIKYGILKNMARQLELI